MQRHLAFLVLLSAAHAVGAQTPIYRCMVDGVPMFSDHVCGGDAKPVTLDAGRLSTYTPVPAAQAPRASSPRKAARSADEPAAPKSAARSSERCASLRATLRGIDDKLRAGYTAKQGVQLEERKRNLRKQARELRC